MDMIKHAILIGINEVPGMNHLFAPSGYAMQMEDWAKSQGYQTALFVDEPGGRTVKGACSRTEILASIREVIEETDQLLIYFAGHGVEHNAGNDVWLLPGYQDDPSDCISLFLNKALAYSSGVPHVVFISDACRSPSGGEALRAVSGSAILPKLNRLNPNTEVDVLYSTWPGQVSVDIKQEGEYRSMYSDSLLKCLKGEVPEVIREVKNISPGFPAVLSNELNRYLKKVVPEAMTNAGRSPQYPMGDIASQDPKFLSRFTESFLVAESGEMAMQYKNRGAEMLVPTKQLNIKVNDFLKREGGRKVSKLKKLSKKSVLYQEFFTSDNIFKDSTTGLFVTGLDEPLVFSRDQEDWLPERERNFAVPQIIRYPAFEDRVPKVFLIGQHKKQYYPVNILQGFYTQAVFDKGILRTVNYYPTGVDQKREARYYSKEIAERKAVIITAAKNGIFQGSDEIASYLRTYKSLDPVLGLFAAYAYFQKGNYEGVLSVFAYMLRDGMDHIIGDLRLLQVLSDRDNRLNQMRDVPLPVLTEGWSYLKMLVNNPYERLSTQLEPGLWASFKEGGLHYLMDNLNFKKI